MIRATRASKETPYNYYTEVGAFSYQNYEVDKMECIGLSDSLCRVLLWVIEDNYRDWWNRGAWKFYC